MGWLVGRVGQGDRVCNRLVVLRADGRRERPVPVAWQTCVEDQGGANHARRSRAARSDACVGPLCGHRSAVSARRHRLRGHTRHAVGDIVAGYCQFRGRFSMGDDDRLPAGLQPAEPPLFARLGCLHGRGARRSASVPASTGAPRSLDRAECRGYGACVWGFLPSTGSRRRSRVYRIFSRPLRTFRVCDKPLFRACIG